MAFSIKPRHQSVFGIGEKINLRFLIQPSETLPVELIRTHKVIFYVKS